MLGLIAAQRSRQVGHSRTRLVPSTTVMVSYLGELGVRDENLTEPPLGSVIPSFCGLWGWRKERIGKGQNLVESNPGGRRRVRLLLSG